MRFIGLPYQFRRAGGAGVAEFAVPRLIASCVLAGHDGEAVVFVPAVDVGEACFAEPKELVFDGGAAVLLLAVERGFDLRLGGSCGADLLEPEGFVAGFERGCGAGDLVGVDEDSVGFERGVDAF